MDDDDRLIAIKTVVLAIYFSETVTIPNYKDDEINENKCKN